MQDCPACTGFTAADSSLGPRGERSETRTMAHIFRCVVVAVDYRLAPEAPFPCPFDDCYEGLRWTQLNAEQLGIDPTKNRRPRLECRRGPCRRGRHRRTGPDDVHIRAQLLLYPMLDDRQRTQSSQLETVVWTAQPTHSGGARTLPAARGQPASRRTRHRRVHKTWRGASAFICVGTLDLFPRRVHQTTRACCSLLESKPSSTSIQARRTHLTRSGPHRWSAARLRRR